MNNKHTPGPWSYYPNQNRIVAFTEYTIANLERSMQPDTDTANAKLIAAAPELLEACEAANEELLKLGVGSSASPAMRLLWAAIANATE